MQQIAAKSTTEKSKLETYSIPSILISFCCNFRFYSEYRKKCDMAKTRLESLQQKEKQYRELMSKLSGNTEKR